MLGNGTKCLVRGRVNQVTAVSRAIAEAAVAGAAGVGVVVLVHVAIARSGSLDGKN